MTPTDAMQIAFARLVSDAAARARFACDPQADGEALAALAPRYVDGFASGVLAKRYHEVRRLLPRCAQTPTFRAAFIAYASRNPMGGLERHRHDAIAFARALGTSLARFERLALEAASGERFVRLTVAQKRLWWWFRARRGGTLHAGSLGGPIPKGSPLSRE